jgi:hypothetical protein
MTNKLFNRHTLIILSIIILLLVGWGTAHAADDHTVYLPLVSGSGSTLGTIPIMTPTPLPEIPALPPTETPTPVIPPTPSATSAAATGNLPDYATLALDVNTAVKTHNAGLNAVNDPPNATTTIFNVSDLTYNMTDLPGSLASAAYTYDRITTTISQKCVVFKAYRPSNGDQYMTLIVTACYPDTIDLTLAPETRFASAYDVLRNLMTAYN